MWVNVTTRPVPSACVASDPFRAKNGLDRQNPISSDIRENTEKALARGLQCRPPRDMPSLRSILATSGLVVRSSPPRAALRNPSTTPPAATAGWVTPARGERRRARTLFAAAAFGAVTLMATWTAVRTVPWFGPLVADTLRAVIGSERVTQLEEAVAAVEDDVKQVASDGKGRTLSDATPAALLVAPAEATPRTVEH